MAYTVATRVTTHVNIVRLIIDSLIPKEMSVIELAKALCQAAGVSDVALSVTDVSTKTETIRLVIIGHNIDYDAVTKIMGEHAATIRDIDEVNVSRGKGPTIKSD